MEPSFDRRDFLRRTTGTLALLLSERGLAAGQTTPEIATPGPAVRFGVIGLGAWGREILTTLGRMPAAQVVTICDSYEPFLRRATTSAPQVNGVADYRRLLDQADLEAVVIATPTHTHRELACAAFEAGKHLYCEVPLAASIDDAQRIAVAALAAPKQVFQAGLQGRSNSLYVHVAQFVKSVLGDLALVNAQWNRKERLDRQLSLYNPASDISWINAHAARIPVVVEPRLFDLLDRCQRLSVVTEGAFDMTVGPLMQAWWSTQKEAAACGAVPDAVNLDAARQAVGFEHLRLDPARRTVHFTRRGMAIDLGAAGKGHAIDAAIEILRDHGVPHALIHGGTSRRARARALGRGGRLAGGLRRARCDAAAFRTARRRARGVGRSWQGVHRPRQTIRPCHGPVQRASRHGRTLLGGDGAPLVRV
jgi:ApbE family/Oxidoreductase family, NAD-binding Rossmann fold